MNALLARHRPESLVCFGGAGRRDAAQFSAHARAIAALLPAPREPFAAAAGHAPSVVLACTDRYHFSAALAACWLRGFAVELPVNGQPATVRALARAPHVQALLHDRDEPLGIDVRQHEQVDARASLPLELGLSHDACALTVYTSGSTGAPSAHPKTLRQLLAEPEAHLLGFGLSEQRCVAVVPPFHIYGLLFGVLIPLLGGGSTLRAAPLQPAELLHELRLHHADVLITVPTQLAALVLALEAANEPTILPPLARVFSSAAPLPAATSDKLGTLGWAVTEILGSTETGGIAQRTGSRAAWMALPGVSFQIGPAAQLSVDSPWLAPESARPLQTADRVEPSEGGGFRHLGRSDAVVKVGGRRIDLGELETRLKQLPGVRDARVLALESERLRGIELLAVVESDSAERRSLRSQLAAHVDPMALPRRFRVVAALPRSETGKVTRNALLALFETSTAAPQQEPQPEPVPAPSESLSFPTERLDDRVRVTIPRDSGFFRGHFDGQPILPGVVQLQHLALAEARHKYPELRVLARLSRVKFKRLIEPGETLELTLERKGPLSVSFLVQCGGQPAASGLLHFRQGDA